MSVARGTWKSVDKASDKLNLVEEGTMFCHHASVPFFPDILL